MRTLVVFCLVGIVAFCTGVPCGPTQAEKNMAAAISQRRLHLSNGDVLKAIIDGEYTTQTLYKDMISLWVNGGLLDYKDSINSIVDLLETANQQAQSPPLLQILLGWISHITDATEMKGYEMIGEAITPIGATAESWTTLAKQVVETHGNYFKALKAFEKVLPKTKVENYGLVDEFVAGIKPDNASMLLQAYSFTTELAALMPSFRFSFNAYLANFLSATFPDEPSEGDYRNSMLLKLIDPHRPQSTVIFPMTPTGVDACNLVQVVWNNNGRCIDHQHLDLKWLVSTYSGAIAADVVYECSDMSEPLICCGIYCERCTNPAGLPTPTMRSLCNQGLESTDNVLVHVYGSGPEPCID